MKKVITVLILAFWSLIILISGMRISLEVIRMEISKIIVDNQEYSLQDTQARNDLDEIFEELIGIKPTFTQGGYYNPLNEFVTDANWGYTDYIPVSPNTKYTISTPANQYVTLYDSNYTFLNLPGEGCIEFTTSANTAYVRLSVYITRQDSCILKKIEDDGGNGTAITVDPVLNVHIDNYNFGSLQDLNDAEIDTFYSFNSYGNIKTEVLNLPSDMPLDGYTWYMVTLAFFNNVESQYNYIQYIFKFDLTYTYGRQCVGGQWYPWRRRLQVTSGERNKIIVDASGNGDYTSFTSALAKAYADGNTDVYVKNGTYDITQEIDLASAGSGPLIGNNVRLFFDSYAFIQCIYTGSNSSVKTNFSPLNASTGNGGFEIHNMKIRCKNVRYCVHDEHNTDAIPYKNIYKNCDMRLDNSESNWDSPQCIGGGLGKFGIIEIEGGRYEGYPHVDDNTYGEISYHNCSASGSRSEIYVKDVYCVNNSVRFGYYGSSELLTRCFVSNCSLKAEPLLRAENQTATTVNMELYKWNNEIRD